jgi:hypothetical protein
VIPESEILLPDESVKGRYQVEVARWSKDRYVSTVPALYATMTDRRLILQPQTRKRYDPAIIPGAVIADARPLKSERRGVTIHLKSDYKINLFVSGGSNAQLINQLRELAALPPSREFDPPIDPDGLQRLIEFFAAL